MASTTKDSRIVRVSITEAELAQLLGAKAIEAGVIDFTPDRVEVFAQGAGAGFEVMFEKDTVTGGG